MASAEKREQLPSQQYIAPIDLFPEGLSSHLVRTPNKKGNEWGMFNLCWKSPIQIVTQTTLEGKKSLMIIGRRMAGPEIMEMLGLVNDDFNPRDVRNDWATLFANPTSELMAIHRQIPNWQIYETEFSTINPLVQSNTWIDPDKRLSPVIMIEDIKNQPKINFSNANLKSTHSLALGPSYLALLSKDVTDTWSEIMKLHHKGKVLIQGMGHNQAIVQALALSQSLIRGEFMQRLIELVK